MATWKPWTEQDHLAFMASANISKSIVSISSPGTHLVPGNDALAVNLTRECNEFAADLKRRNPDKFGFWASLPLPDIQGSLTELAYALDVLNADGIAVLTNVHGVYLGDATLAPIFAELSRRNATVFMHPTSPCIGNGVQTQAAAPLAKYPNPMFEFFFDTTRAIINLFLSGTVDKTPGVTYIVPHAGGALPPVIERFTYFATALLGINISSDTVKKAFNRQFYFDLAGFVFPDQIYGLLRDVNASRILYGSDYPYTPGVGVIQLAQLLNQDIGTAIPSQADQIAVYRGNAEALLQ